eukprot:jgi/Bigna1/133158/aug1.20_g7866
MATGSGSAAFSYKRRKLITRGHHRCSPSLIRWSLLSLLALVCLRILGYVSTGISEEEVEKDTAEAMQKLKFEVSDLRARLQRCQESFRMQQQQQQQQQQEHATTIPETPDGGVLQKGSSRAQPPPKCDCRGSSSSSSSSSDKDQGRTNQIEEEAAAGKAEMLPKAEELVTLAERKAKRSPFEMATEHLVPMPSSVELTIGSPKDWPPFTGNVVFEPFAEHDSAAGRAYDWFLRKAAGLTGIPINFARRSVKICHEG